MRNDTYLKTLLRKGKRFAKRVTCVGLAGYMLVGGSLIAQAATLDDVFDAEQYADDYADLKEAFGYDRAALLNHYKTYGILEGRKVSGLLDIAKYRGEYPDLYAAFGDDWDAYVNHFLTFGILEGRDSGTDFDVLAYVERYPDLKAAFGDDFLALYQHYQTLGKNEGRTAATVVKAAPKQNSTTANQVSSQSSMQTDNHGGAYTKIFYFDDGTYVVNEYNDVGNLVKQTLYEADGSISVWFTWEYDNAGVLLKSTQQNSRGIVSWGEYIYDSAGNEIKCIYHDGDDNITGWYESEYDSAGRLDKETRYDANGNITGWYEYEYDSDGNRTSTWHDADENEADDTTEGADDVVAENTGENVGDDIDVDAEDDTTQNVSEDAAENTRDSDAAE